MALPGTPHSFHECILASPMSAGDQDMSDSSSACCASQPSIDSVHTSYTSLCSSPFDGDADAFEHCNFSQIRKPAQASPFAVDNVSSANCFMGYGASESQFTVANVDGFGGFGWSYDDFDLYPAIALPSKQTVCDIFNDEIPAHSVLEDSELVEASEAALSASNSLLPGPIHKDSHSRPPAPRESGKKISPSKPPSAKSRKKAVKRHPCMKASCVKSFTRHSDLVRHEQDVHRLGDTSFECFASGCGHTTRRKDKMKEHCRTMHRHAAKKEIFGTLQSGDRIEVPVRCLQTK